MAINPQTRTGVTSRSSESEAPSSISTGGNNSVSGLMSFLEDFLAKQESSIQPGERFPTTLFQANPKSPFQSFTGPEGRHTRVVTGGFAPGSFGATVQDLFKQIAGSFGKSRGLPSRESLLGPRRGDINDVINQALQGESNRFAGLGRSVSGSVPTQNRAVLEGTRAREINRAGGDVDTLLAQLGIGQQGFDIQSLVALMNILGQL